VATISLRGKAVVLHRRGAESMPQGWLVQHHGLFFFLSILCSFLDVVSSRRHLYSFSPAINEMPAFAESFKKKYDEG
jgi:hypothetical protein